MSISIVLPVFNEVKSLEYVLSVWNRYLNKKKILHEFVICEDGSTDGTKELIVKLQKKYPISNQSVKDRRGYGLGVISGIIASKYDYILCIDSDGQCMPDSFLEFYNNKHMADILRGNRNPRNDPIIRIIYSKLFKIVHDYLFNTKIKDPSCPYVLSKKKNYLMLLDKLQY
jgi:glycosyltransferase involved in cell wall biosynthesis